MPALLWVVLGRPAELILDAAGRAVDIITAAAAIAAVFELVVRMEGGRLVDT